MATAISPVTALHRPLPPETLMVQIQGPTQQERVPHISGLTPDEAAGIETFEKPDPGTWTESFGLPKGPVSLRDSFDPDFFELEKEAVFRRSWLNVGRVERLPRPGSYFTVELEFLGLSVLVVRGMDDQIRAFHNVCSHRGNKLVWDDFPSKESAGTCRQLACKYHGWRYDLDGSISYVHNAPEFFDLNAEDLALPKINLDTWAGFIFINLEENSRQGLREFLTPTVAKLESFPFGEMTHTYVFESVIQCNWKLFKDAFQESYHFPHVHGKATNPDAAHSGKDKVPSMVPYFGRFGKHGIFTSTGPTGNKAIRAAYKLPVNALLQADVFGYEKAVDLPTGDGINPGRVKQWGFDSWQIYPNFTIVARGRNNYFTFSYWPLSPSTHRVVWTVNFTPPKNAREWLAAEHATNVNRELASEDVAPLEATQQAISCGQRDRFFVCDQEVLVRLLHTVVAADVDAYRNQHERTKG